MNSSRNSSPPSTFRPLTSPHKKSRIPLATSPTSSSNNGITFRQWADPPPAPTRSRTLERKVSHPVKRRPGSADPRFRRTLELKSSPDPYLNHVQAEIKKESSSSCELSTTSFNDNKTEQLSEYSGKTELVRKEETTDFLKVKESIDVDSKKLHNNRNENYVALNVTETVKTEEATSILDTDTETTETENNDRNIIALVDKVEVSTQDETASEEESCTTRSASKYSQTDLCASDINEFIPDYTFRNQEITTFPSSNYDKSRYLDGLVLNRTRSIATLYELEPVANPQLNEAKDYCESISHVVLKQSYFTYFEVWAAIGFFLAILIFTWVCVIPYVVDLYFSWIHPKPTLTASNYIRKSATDIVRSTYELIYGLLTTPAKNRMY